MVPPSLGAAKATARAELLEGALARAFDEPVNVVVTASYRELEAAATSGSAELVWAPAAVCAMLPAARAIFTVVREGKPSYRSALVVRSDHAARSAERLTGARAAWVDPLSAGGYALAIAMLRDRGLLPDQLFSSQVFLGTHRAAIEAVLHGEADVTAVSVASTDDESIAARLRWYAGPAGDQLIPIAITDACPSDAIVITAATPEDRALALAAKLRPNTPGARMRSRLLSALEADDLIAASLADYRPLRSALLWSATGVRPSKPPPAPNDPSKKPTEPPPAIPRPSQLPTLKPSSPPRAK